ncbi:MAG: hypothetical protein WAJ86_01780, partial [Candidatus Acidiferrales bacterium]
SRSVSHCNFSMSLLKHAPRLRAVSDPSAFPKDSASSSSASTGDSTFGVGRTIAFHPVSSVIDIHFI